MSRKISIKDKREWLAMYEQGKTEVQIARALKRDPRTVAKGIEEAFKDRRLSRVEEDMIRTAFSEHQQQLKGVLKDIASTLVMPPYNLELREEKTGLVAPMPLSGGLVKHISEEQFVLEIFAEQKLEWGLLQEHLRQDKVWDYLKRWRMTLLDHIMARWQFKLFIRQSLEKKGMAYRGKHGDTESDYFLLILWDLLYGVAMNRILGIQQGTDLEKNLVPGEDNWIRHGPGGTELAFCNNTPACTDKIISVFTSLPNTPKGNKVKESHEELAQITNVAKREVEELILLNMVTGRCRVCRRLGQ